MSGRQNWGTPQWLYNEICEKLPVVFTVDACAEAWSAKCTKYWTKEEDGLAQSWADEVVFCNPPYSNIKPWLEKGLASATGLGARVVYVLPSSTDTLWFHDYAALGRVILLRGRVQFDLPPGRAGSSCGNTGGTMLVDFCPDPGGLGLAHGIYTANLSDRRSNR